MRHSSMMQATMRSREAQLSEIRMDDSQKFESSFERHPTVFLLNYKVTHVQRRLLERAFYAASLSSRRRQRPRRLERVR